MHRGGARHRRPRISPAGFSTRPEREAGEREKLPRKLEIAQKVTEKLRSRIVL